MSIDFFVPIILSLLTNRDNKHDDTILKRVIATAGLATFIPVISVHVLCMKGYLYDVYVCI